MACELEQVHHLTVLTFDLETFQVLHGIPGVRVYITGGERDERTGSLVGPLACRSVESLQFRRCFLSTTHLDARLGTSEATLEEADVKQAFARSITANSTVPPRPAESPFPTSTFLSQI